MHQACRTEGCDQRVAYSDAAHWELVGCGRAADASAFDSPAQSAILKVSSVTFDRLRAAIKQDVQVVWQSLHPGPPQHLTC